MKVLYKYLICGDNGLIVRDAIEFFQTLWAGEIQGGDGVWNN